MHRPLWHNLTVDGNESTLDDDEKVFSASANYVIRLTISHNGVSRRDVQLQKVWHCTQQIPLLLTSPS